MGGAAGVGCREAAPRQRELRLLQERADSQVERLTQAHQVLSARVLGGRPAGPLSEYGAEEQE